MKVLLFPASFCFLKSQPRETAQREGWGGRERKGKREEKGRERKERKEGGEEGRRERGKDKEKEGRKGGRKRGIYLKNPHCELPVPLGCSGEEKVIT